jgi:short-subunit dehydrogenase
MITGTRQGIGKACAEVLAAKGADLILIDPNPDTLARVCDRLSETGRQVSARELDLTDEKRTFQVVAELSSKGLIDIFINNAGFDQPGTTARIDTRGFLEVLNIYPVVPLTLIQY